APRRAKKRRGHGRRLQEAVEGRATLEGADGGENRAGRVEVAAANVTDLVERDGVESFDNLVDGHDFAEKQLLAAVPTGDGTRVFHAELDAPAAHVASLGEFRFGHGVEQRIDLGECGLGSFAGAVGVATGVD